MIIGALIGWFLGLVLFLACAFVGQRNADWHNEQPLLVTIHGRAYWNPNYGTWIVLIMLMIAGGAIIGYFVS